MHPFNSPFQFPHFCRAKLLKVRIGANSGTFGPLLKTSCGADEVCLGDSVPEAAEKYPDEQLEVEVGIGIGGELDGEGEQRKIIEKV